MPLKEHESYSWRVDSILPETSHKLYKKDLQLLDIAQRRADLHDSGGSFSMCAVAQLRSWRRAGQNKLKRSPKMRFSDYPESCGVHAELDLWYRQQQSLSNTTVAIAGTKRRNGTVMPNTRPCAYCAALLSAAKVSYVIYRHEGEIRKNRVAELVDDLLQ